MQTCLFTKYFIAQMKDACKLLAVCYILQFCLQIPLHSDSQHLHYTTFSHLADALIQSILQRREQSSSTFIATHTACLLGVVFSFLLADLFYLVVKSVKVPIDHF